VRGAYLDNLQVLRLVAAAAILFSHAADRFLTNSSIVWRVPWVAGVDLFFVISGLVMGLLAHGCWGQPAEARRFLLRRAIRIVPTYWFFTLLLAGAVLVSGGQIDGSRVTGESLAASLLFLPYPRPSDGQLVPLLAQGWTLNFEMAFYLAVGLALLSRRGPWLLGGGFLLLAASGRWWPLSWSAARFYADPIILEFLAGTGLALLHWRGLRLHWSVALLLGGLAVGWLGYAEQLLQTGERAILFGGAAVLAVAAAALGPSAPAGRFKRTLMLGGDASYALYLSHTFVVGAAIRMLPGAGLDSWGGLLLTMLAALAFATAFHLIAERPITARLQRLAAP
jgi:peptidoglycan/LPS O-acetylase OafA/YrhL